MPGAGDIGLGLLVGAAVNCIVRTLEEQGFAVEHQLDAGIRIFRVEAAQTFARQHDRNRDVVFHLHFVGGMKIRPQFVNAPGTVAVVAHAQVIVHQLLIRRTSVRVPRNPFTRSTAKCSRQFSPHSGR